MPDWEWLSEFPGTYRVARLQNVTICRWEGDASPAAMHELGVITERALRTLEGGKLSNIHLIPGSVRLPDSESRAALQEVTNVYGAQYACVGVVLHGGGFWASAVRSVLTGVQVLAPRSFELRIHSEVHDLLEWFPRENLSRTGVKIEPADLQRALEAIKAG